jgi:hypothetical protein
MVSVSNYLVVLAKEIARRPRVRMRDRYPRWKGPPFFRKIVVKL